MWNYKGMQFNKCVGNINTMELYVLETRVQKWHIISF